jgi:hypothetical protein
LPEEWKGFTEYSFWTLVRNLDKYNSGYVNWKTLATYLCLLESQLPTDKEIDEYNQEL